MTRSVSFIQIHLTTLFITATELWQK